VSPRAARRRLGAGLAPYRWRLVGVALGLLVYGLLLIVATGPAHGVRQSEEQAALLGLLITVPVLVLLVAGGNWLQHWLGIHRRPPQFAEPPREDEERGTAP
jgi:hypothetical protein